MSRPAELISPGRGCSSRRRCRKRSCGHCGPIRADDEWRKFHDNLVAYGGAVALVTVTAPGADVLPWDANVCGNDDHAHSGPRGCLVHEEAANAYNVTASARYARLFKAAAKSADRLLRRGGYRGRMPRRVAVVWSEQSRGVWHVHEALPAASELERAWSRQAVRFMEQAQKREAGMSAAERRALLDLERLLEQPTRGFYGWGFVDRNPLRKGGRLNVTEGRAAAARYLARNVAGYLVENVQADPSDQG